MKILYITFVYNERPYIADAISYYKKQGCDVYIIDNMSTDGTYEWLVSNNIKCSRFDSGESFDLAMLQKELERILKIEKPDWFVYAAPDLFYVFEKDIRNTIELADAEGYNQLTVRCYGALNTGEKYKTPLYKAYFHGRFYRDLEMISKYNDKIVMNGDNIIIPNVNKKKVQGIMVNYGACKPIEDQKIKLARRQKAWDNGLSMRTGKHFKSGSLIDWTWKKEDCLNFHRCIDKKYFKKLYEE
ncbi:MAG TPA: glycosyltransferase family 2 protein [Methanosarcinales archaeon]|nr:glycosyltransferase family 2 protein [Methanosarcinales archaeon]